MCLSQNGLNALHLASKEGHVEVVAELLKLEAAVDAATKVRPTPSPATQLMLWRTIFGSGTKHGWHCDRKKACKYSVPTVSVQPSLGFNIQSIFNDPCGGCCWLKVRELSKTKWNNEAEGVQYNNSGMSELGKCVIKNEVGFILCTVLWY